MSQTLYTGTKGGGEGDSQDAGANGSSTLGSGTQHFPRAGYNLTDWENERLEKNRFQRNKETKAQSVCSHKAEELFAVEEWLRKMSLRKRRKSRMSGMLQKKGENR